MPMNFPNLESLKREAEVHKFRPLNEGETEKDYRIALADHVALHDFIEGHEVRTGKGWDRWSPAEKQDLFDRNVDLRSRRGR